MMDLLSQLSTSTTKGMAFNISFFEFYFRTPQSAFQQFVGAEKWKTRRFGKEVAVKKVDRDHSNLNYWQVKVDGSYTYSEEETIQKTILTSTAIIILIPGMAAPIQGYVWNYFLGNERLNPRIPLLLVAENPEGLGADECREKVTQQLDLEAAWLREYEIICLSKDRKSWEVFVSRLVEKVLAFTTTT